MLDRPHAGANGCPCSFITVSVRGHRPAELPCFVNGGRQLLFLIDALARVCFWQSGSFCGHDLDGIGASVNQGADHPANFFWSSHSCHQIGEGWQIEEELIGRARADVIAGRYHIGDVCDSRPMELAQSDIHKMSHAERSGRCHSGEKRRSRRCHRPDVNMSVNETGQHPSPLEVEYRRRRKLLNATCSDALDSTVANNDDGIANGLG